MYKVGDKYNVLISNIPYELEVVYVGTKHIVLLDENELTHTFLLSTFAEKILYTIENVPYGVWFTINNRNAANKYMKIEKNDIAASTKCLYLLINQNYLLSGHNINHVVFIQD